MSNKIAVIAGSFTQFKQFAGLIDAQDRDIFVYVGHVRHLEGQAFSSVIRIGNYWEILEWDELYDKALVRVR